MFRRLIITGLKQLRRVLRGRPVASSAGYSVPDAAEHEGTEGIGGWGSVAVAKRHHAAFHGVLEDMYEGLVRKDLLAACEGIGKCRSSSPSVLEVGCGDGCHSEVFKHLLKFPVRYTGLDMSPAMIAVARKTYPSLPLLIGDAARLPFASASFDAVFNGAALMHIVEYREVVRESARVAADICVFHTVTVYEGQRSLILTKKAYGASVAEVVFSKSELRGIFADCGLLLIADMESIPYDLSKEIGERTESRTYVCRVEKNK